MMREEFTELTKVEVSGRYYRDVIEPMYTEANEDKHAFCADWVKRNKSLLVKTHLADFNKLNMDICVSEGNQARVNEVLEEKRKLEAEIKRFASELQQATLSFACDHGKLL